MEDILKIRWWIIFLGTEAIAAGVLWLIGLLSPWMLIVTGGAILFALAAWDQGGKTGAGIWGRRLRWGVPVVSFGAVVVMGAMFGQIGNQELQSERDQQSNKAHLNDAIPRPMPEVPAALMAPVPQLHCLVAAHCPLENFSPPEWAKKNDDGTPRIFVRESLTDLMRRFNQFTELQAQSASQTYVGKWVAIGGTVGEVKPLFDRITVRLEEGTSPAVFPNFDKSRADTLAVYNVGDHFRAVCRVNLLDAMRAFLEDCRVVP